ncbi:MAG: pentapeptide repeat-containing protein [Candidatus Nitrosopumilus sp. bin_7KS]
MIMPNQSLGIACFLILSVSFSIIFIYLTLFETYTTPTLDVEGNFDGVDFNKKKILVLGASSVDVLNFTSIDRYLAEHGFMDYEVYNLTEDGDRPTERITQIQEIIDIDPDLVLYGIGMREFGYDTFSPGMTNCLPLNYDAFWNMRKETPNKIKITDTSYDTNYFEPLAIIKNEIKRNTVHIFPDFVEPKFATVSLLNNALYQKDIRTESFLNKNYTELKKQGGVNKIVSNEILKEKIKHRVFGYCEDTNKDELSHLGIILERLQEENIDVKVFVAPYSGPYLDVLSDLTIRHYFTGLYKTTNSSNVELYSFLDRYKNLDIFYDATHVAASPESSVYSEEFAFFTLNIIDNKRDHTTQNLSEFQYGKLPSENMSKEQINNLPSLENLNLSGVDLAKENISRKKIIGSDLTQANLEQVNFSYSIFTDTVLNGANMYFANLTNTKITNTSMNGANLIFADVTNATLSDIDLRHSLVMRVDFSNLNITNIDFSGANLLSANFSNSQISNVDFSSADLSMTDFRGAQIDNKTRFTGTKLIESNLSNFDMSFLDLSGVVLTGANLTNTSFKGSEFTFSDLSGVDLSTSDLSGAILLATDLSFTNIPNAQFSQINAKHANFENANLTNADFSLADFIAAQFVNSNLTGANFTGTKVQFANFTGAILDGAYLQCLDNLICDERTR